MSLVETPASAASNGGVMWAAVGLGVAGAAAVFGALLLSGAGAQLCLVGALAVLLALLGLIVWYPNAFVTVSQRGWNRPVANFAYIVPVVLLTAMGFNFHLVRLEAAALAAAGMGCLAVAGMIWAPRPQPVTTPMSHILLSLVFAAGLGWGGLTWLNCLFDSGPGQDFQVGVQAKYASFGRGSHYHLTLAPFGPVEHPVSVTVSYATYAGTSEGGFVCTVLRPGALGLPWWRLGGC
jgi:hypothetical protein